MALINTTTTGVLGTTVYGDGAGALTVQKDGVTIGKVTSAPAFSAYASVLQSVTTGTWTKAAINTKVFDTASCYDTTNYRFTPNVEGYYQFSAGLWISNGFYTAAGTSLYKNGSQVKTNLFYIASANGIDDFESVISGLIYLNGTTDYVELYGFAVGGTPRFNEGLTNCWFDGFLARAA